MLTDSGTIVSVVVISLFVYRAVCVDVHMCVCQCTLHVCVCLRVSVDSIKESDRKHFCCLDWSRGPGPHNAMFSLFSLHGLQC